jgi:S1-C subfamily serine protease
VRLRLQLLPALTLLAATLTAPAAHAARPDSGINKAVVKVFSTASPTDLRRPWQRGAMESGSGSGVILKSGLVLTNAHVVSNAVSIEVKLDGSTERYPARIAFASPACDLALVEVKDPAFFEGSRHLDLGAMPHIQDAVEVMGYPEGGESLSITAGVVSRIELNTYAHSFYELLLAQLDAAINPGNSGGPVVAGGRLVGIAVQTRKDAQNIGYMVPLPVIRQFLKDTEDGRVDGPQRMGIGVQDLESPAHRAQLGLAARETGAAVMAVNHGSPSWGVLEVGDVILSIDGQSIASDLSMASPYGARLSWVAALTEMQAGDEVNLELVRNGQHVQKSVRLFSWQPLVPGPHMSDVTRYRIVGGLVFQPLTVDYLIMEGDDADVGFVNLYRYQNIRTPDRDESLILSQVLPGDASRGYFEWADEIVARVQGQTPRDLTHLNEIIDSATGRWLEVEMASGIRIVINLEEARRTTPEILQRFAIGADRSPKEAGAAAARVGQ